MSKPASPSIFELGFHIFNKWMYLKQKGVSLEMFFRDNLFAHVAIYGYGALGQRLAADMERMDVEFGCIIDRNAENIRVADIPVLTLADELPAVDVVVVTTVQFYGEIEAQLEEVTDACIVSMEDLVEYVYERNCDFNMV